MLSMRLRMEMMAHRVMRLMVMRIRMPATAVLMSGMKARTEKVVHSLRWKSSGNMRWRMVRQMMTAAKDER